MEKFACNECGKETVDRAQTCPHCGAEPSESFLDKAKSRVSQLKKKAKLDENINKASDAIKPGVQSFKEKVKTTTSNAFNSMKSDYNTGGFKKLLKNRNFIVSGVVALILVITMFGGSKETEKITGSAVSPVVTQNEAVTSQSARNVPSFHGLYIGMTLEEAGSVCEDLAKRYQAEIDPDIRAVLSKEENAAGIVFGTGRHSGNAILARSGPDSKIYSIQFNSIPLVFGVQDMPTVDFIKLFQKNYRLKFGTPGISRDRFGSTYSTFYTFVDLERETNVQMMETAGRILRITISSSGKPSFN